LTATRHDVFISYKSEDLPLAESLHQRLVQAGFSVWFDRIRLKPGFRWYGEIEDGCEKSRILLPVLTPRWRTSEWTKFETYGAEAIIPLHFAGAWEDVATPPLLYHQNAVVDLHEPDATTWETLFTSIREIVNRPAPAKPARLAHVTLRANPYFTGRERELNFMHEALHPGPTASLTQGVVYAVTALGGWGKTTLAREYVEKFWRAYRQIFWVNACEDTQAGFADVGRVLRPDLADQTDQLLADIALHTLSDRTERLLVLDGVDDEEAVQRWIPKTGGCRTIITSHFAAWSAVVENRPLYVLDPVPSRDLLCNRAERCDTPENRAAADRLAGDLEYLPLALEQAAAYVQQEGAGFGFDDYREIFRYAARDMLDEDRAGSCAYATSVASAWKTTVEKLSWEARAALRIASFLSPVPIPKSFFIASADEIDSLADFMCLMATGTHRKPSGDAAPEIRVRRILGELADYSLITNLGATFAIHSMVQTVERTGIPDSGVCRCVTAAVTVVGGVRPADLQAVATWPEWRAWVPHARSLVEHAEEAGFTDDLGEIYWWAGAWLERMASYPEAERLLRRALELERVRSGDRSPIVALHQNNLSGLLRTTGHREEARELALLAHRSIEQCLGPGHELAVAVLNNLGLIHRADGSLREAEAAFREALRIVGEDDSAAAQTRAPLLLNLGAVLCEAHRFAEAERVLEQALAMDTAALGPDHPGLAKTLINLATLWVATNRFGRAEEACRLALTICETAFGPEHPEVAVCLNDLARVYQEMGQHADAEPLLKRAYGIDAAILGPDHETVAIRLNNLAGVMKKTGRLAEAEDTMRRSLAIRERTLGPDDKLTYHMYSRLADVLRLRGALKEAEDFARRSAAGWSRSEAPHSYKAGRARRVLALVHRDAGRAAEAVAEMQRAVAIYEGALVENDPRLESVRLELGGMDAPRVDPGA